MSRRAAGFAAAAGSAAGAEQRAAREAAEACGAQVVLGAPGLLARPYVVSLAAASSQWPPYTVFLNGSICASFTCENSGLSCESPG